MKILINAINDNAQPRGPDRYLDELLDHMVAANPDLRFDLCTAPWQHHFIEKDYGPSVTCHVMDPPRGAMGRVRWHALRFARLANARAPDVVLLPNYIWTPGLAAPSVVVAHDMLQFRAPDKFGALKALALRRLIRASLRRADHVISVSEFTAGDLQEFARVPARKITVILEGGPSPRPRSGPADMTLLYVGKIERTKNVDLLIQAFAGSQLLQDLNAELVIVGPDGNASGDLAAQFTQPRVRRMGFVSDAELERLYARCRAFVFPSSAEGFGLVLLEAMACGAPVIAADATSLPEVCGDAAILVPDRDVARLRKAMERVCTSDALAADLQTKGYERLKAFSWDQAARQTIEVLRQTATPGAPA